jgi:hypothetical protein
MEMNASSEASVTQECSSVLCSSKSHYYFVYKHSTLAPILSQINPIHTTAFCISMKHFNLGPHIFLGLAADLLLSGFPMKVRIALLNARYTACKTRPSLPDHYSCITPRVQKTPWPSVRKRNMPTEGPPLVGEIQCNFYG